jgi:hypothetical protein
MHGTKVMLKAIVLNTDFLKPTFFILTHTIPYQRFDPGHTGTRSVKNLFPLDSCRFLAEANVVCPPQERLLAAKCCSCPTLPEKDARDAVYTKFIVGINYFET